MAASGVWPAGKTASGRHCAPVSRELLFGTKPHLPSCSTPSCQPPGYDAACFSGRTEVARRQSGRCVRASAGRTLSPAEPVFKIDKGHAAKALTQLQRISDYKQLGQWLQKEAASAEASSDGAVDVHLLVAALCKAADEVDPLFWTSLQELSEEDVLALSEFRDQALDLLKSLLLPATESMSVGMITFCGQYAVRVDSFEPHDLLRIMCQRVLKTSRSTAPPTSDSPSEQQGPAYLDCQPEEVDMVVTQICDALGKAGYYSPQVLQLLAKELVVSVSLCSPSTIAGVLRTFMQLQHYDKTLLSALGRHLLRSSPQLDESDTPSLNLTRLQPMEAVDVATAFAFFNVQNKAFYQVLLARASAAQLDDVTWLSLHSLYQCCLLMAHDVPIPPAVHELLASTVDASIEAQRADDAARRAFVTEGTDEEELQTAEDMVHYSAFDALALRQLHRLLGGTATSPGVCRVYERASTQAYYCEIDMVVRGQALDGAERDVAILLQPDDAFCLNQPTRMLGKAQLRIRCLQRLGWPVWSLRLDEWQDQVCDAAEVAGVAEDYLSATHEWARVMSLGADAEPEAVARVKRMTDELQAWLQTGITGTATLSGDSSSRSATGTPAQGAA